MRPLSNRFAIYALINLAFALLVGIACAASGFSNPRLLYLFLMAALCTSVVIDLDGFNGRYALLALFMLVYFVSFAVGDLTDLLPGYEPPVPKISQGDAWVLNQPEIVILVGGSLWALGYRLAAYVVAANPPKRNPRDWSKTAILIVGLTLWIIGTIALYRWNVYILTDTTNEAVKKGLASISPLVTSAYVLAQLVQPLGILLLIYSMIIFRDAYQLLIVVAAIAAQIFIGFVIDIKGVAMLGLILIILSRVLLVGRLPKVWLVVGVLFVTLAYPYFTAYRAAIHGGGIARTAVVENFGQILEKTIAAKDKVNSGRERAGTFLERSNVKGSVEVIVERTGNGVEFQGGHTLSPILLTFVPRILWAEKQGVAPGQLFNKQFHLTESDDISISPSQLGEMYWNFGWSGVVLGMSLVGMLCGWIGARFNLSKFRTVTRILVTVITIKLLIVGFEGAIADAYVTWIRSLAGIGVLHLIFARFPTAAVSPRSAGREQSSESNQTGGGRLFPNLLT